MNKDLLTRPFPPELIRQRQGQGGKMLSYVETHAVIARLNSSLEAWSFEVIRHEILEDEVIVIGKLNAEGIIKMAFGGSAITRDRDGRPVSVADDLKSAASDALKKTASLLGVALELYGGGAARGEQRGAADEPSPHQEHAPAPTSPTDRLTEKQYAAVQAIARRKNLSREGLTNMLQERFRKTDLNTLTRREASSLLSEMTEANGAHH